MRSKHSCAGSLELYVHSALTQAAAQGCVDDLLHKSIISDCFRSKSSFPLTKGTTTAQIT